MSQLADLGNGLGFMYLTTPDSNPLTTMIKYNLGNTQDNVRVMLKELLVSGPVITGTRAYFLIDVVDVALAGDILDIVVGGVSQISAPVAAVVGDADATALAISNAINSYVASPNYTAQVFGPGVYVYAEIPGAAPNGTLTTVTTDPSITVTTNGVVQFGSDPADNISQTWGIRVWLNATSGATAGVLSGDDITDDIVYSFVNGRAQVVELIGDDTNGNIMPTRAGTLSYATVGGTGAPAQIGSINMRNVRPGDRLMIWGRFAGQSIQIMDVSATIGSVPNIFTENQAPYTSESPQEIWQGIYLEDGFLGSGWYEVSRTTAHSITIADLAAADIPQGLPTTASVTPILGGTTFTLVPRTDPQTQVLTGGPYALTGNNNFVGDAAAIAGDTFTISGGGVVVTDAGGQILVEGATVPEQMAAQGTWTATMKYNGSAWVCEGIYADMTGSEIIQDSQIFDLDGAKIQAASIPAGKYGASSIVGADISNGTITSNKLDASTQAALAAISTVYSISTTIPTADVLTLNATPYEIIPAPAAGLGIEVVSASARMVFNATPYGGDFNFVLVTDGVGVTNYQAENILTLQNTFGDHTHRFTIFQGTTAALNQVVAAQALMATTLTSDPTLGDSDIIVNVLYRLIPC